MSKELQDKIAVVTGGSRGIGKAIAQKLLGEGATVIIGNRGESEIKCTVQELAPIGNVTGEILDVADRKSVQDFVNRSIEKYGRIDILVNCAGTNFRSSALDYPEEEWERVINVNLNGAYRMCQEVGRHMVSRNYGKIINVTSLMSHVVTPNQSAYAASKAGLAQFTKLLAVEWGQFNINVNGVSPGYIITELSKDVLAIPAFQDKILDKTPQKRVGTPDEIAEAAAFLATDRARFINGHMLVADGGFLAGHPSIFVPASH
jgi:NAD(P)-dependent dehydrogenase (short-subunit alcohol dehydrogenase family)